jgi:hypothetical protein
MNYTIWFNLPLDTIYFFYFSAHNWSFKFKFGKMVADNVRHVKNCIS